MFWTKNVPKWSVNKFCCLDWHSFENCNGGDIMSKKVNTNLSWLEKEEDKYILNLALTIIDVAYCKPRKNWLSHFKAQEILKSSMWWKGLFAEARRGKFKLKTLIKPGPWKHLTPTLLKKFIYSKYQQKKSYKNLKSLKNLLSLFVALVKGFWKFTPEIHKVICKLIILQKCGW